MLGHHHLWSSTHAHHITTHHTQKPTLHGCLKGGAGDVTVHAFMQEGVHLELLCYLLDKPAETEVVRLCHGREPRAKPYRVEE